MFWDQWGFCFSHPSGLRKEDFTQSGGSWTQLIDYRQIWFEYFLMVWKFNSYIYSHSLPGVGLLHIHAPIGTYGLDVLIIMKFGLNTS